jgi:chloramphenicol O-acetyltransferase
VCLNLSKKSIYILRMVCQDKKLLDYLNNIQCSLEIILKKDYHYNEDIVIIKQLLCNILNENNKFASNIIFALLMKINDIKPFLLRYMADELINDFSVIVSYFYHRTFSIEIACM